MNNYENAKFADSTSCFFPKKSFNKVINKNLLANKLFLFENGIDETDALREQEMAKQLHSSFNFYSEKVKRKEF